MKVKNLEVGMTVKVKKKAVSWQKLNGLEVKIIKIDLSEIPAGEVYVQSSAGTGEWFESKELKRIK